jgi:hypothetical protein
MYYRMMGGHTVTDRELLEKAARAAGYAEPNWPPRSDCNPLTNDADAFRLMVDLMMVIKVYKNAVTAEPFNGIEVTASVRDFNGDPHAATRRAIVMAAAAMVDTGDNT